MTLNETIAIVIGISYYHQKEFLFLPAAEVDAVRFARAIKNWGIEEKNIFLFLNDEINKRTLEDLFNQLSLKKESYNLVFYFCGHGFRTSNSIPESHLLFSDSVVYNQDCIDSFKLDELLEKISLMNALESYIFIDACHLRINTFINPKLIGELKEEKNAHKSLFCLLSSGIEESFENIQSLYGYFTKALLYSLCKIRKSDHSPTVFYNHIQQELCKEGLAIPDMVNFGNQQISFFKEKELECKNTIIDRFHVLSEIQDVLIKSPYSILLLQGDKGSGKTTILKSLYSHKLKSFLITIPDEINEDFLIENFIEEEIQRKFSCSFLEFNELYPYYLILIDQLDKLSFQQLNILYERLYEANHLKFICASANYLPSQNQSIYQIPPFSSEEGILYIKTLRHACPDEQIELIYLLSQGNPLKIKKALLVKEEPHLLEIEPFKKAIAALFACGIYYNQSLFEKTFSLKKEVLDFLKSSELILPFEDGFIPHQFLIDFAEKELLSIPAKNILDYWILQAKEKPFHIEIAKSLILAAKCFSFEKKHEKALKQAIECLPVNKENLHYFQDAAEIFLCSSYYSKTTSLVAKILEKLGEIELSYKLQKLSSKTKRKVLFLASFLMLFIFTISYVSFSRQTHLVHIKQIHPDFVGRRAILDQLKENLSLKKTDTLPTAILWGEGGIGKSEIAIAFANENANQYNLIHWMDCATDEGLLSSYQHLAKQLNISIDHQESIKSITRKVHDFLENTKSLRFLLIYDNTENEHELPERGNGAIIITTRDNALWHSLPHFEINRFETRESLLLLNKITSNISSNSQKVLIKELENYPLSLNLAAHYIAETPFMSEDSYLELLSQNKVALLDTMPTNTRYPKGLLNSWKMTSKQIEEIHPKTLSWLHFSSYLYPDEIPSQWIEDWLNVFSQEPIDSYTLKMEVNSILRLVINKSIMRYDQTKKSLSLHRLKQEIFKYDDYFDPSTKSKVLQFLVQSLENYERIDEMERTPSLWPKIHQWEPHAVWFIENHSQSMPKDKLALLNNLLGSWKTIKGEYVTAEKYFDKALNLRQDLYGNEDVSTNIALNNKAWILMKLGKLNESKETYLKAIKFLENNPKNQYPTVGFIMNNLTIVLKELGEYQLMKEYNEKVLAWKINAYGQNHHYTADSFHNLGISLINLEEHEKAVENLLKALISYQNFYGEKHPYVTITKHSLGRAYLYKGDYDFALTYLREAVELYTKLYNENHPYVLRCLINIGEVKQKQGLKKEALEIYQKTYNTLKTVHNKEHPDIINTLKKIQELSGN